MFDYDDDIDYSKHARNMRGKQFDVNNRNAKKLLGQYRNVNTSTISEDEFYNDSLFA